MNFFQTTLKFLEVIWNYRKCVKDVSHLEISNAINFKIVLPQNIFYFNMKLATHLSELFWKQLLKSLTVYSEWQSFRQKYSLKIRNWNLLIEEYCKWTDVGTFLWTIGTKAKTDVNENLKISINVDQRFPQNVKNRIHWRVIITHLSNTNSVLT